MPFLNLTFALNIARMFSAKVDWKGSLTEAYKEYSWQKRLAFGMTFRMPIAVQRRIICRSRSKRALTARIGAWKKYKVQHRGQSKRAERL